MDEFNQYLEKTGEIGFTMHAGDAMAYVSGLPKAKPGEVVYFETGERGQVTYLEEEKAEIFVFSKQPIPAGTRVTRTNSILTLPVGDEYIGRIIDPFGNLLDQSSSFKKPEQTRIIENPPPGIDLRKKITKSLVTGVTLVDMLVPLGMGQRELVIGDRKTGKTSFLLQTIYTQATKGLICIYVAIGKKKFDVKAVEGFFKRNDILDKVIMMVAMAEDPISSIFITPFSAMTLAEYFRDSGRDVLLVLDDLNTHAKFYRQISLLGKRFPGRNAYPADIFYTHARLLERAGNFDIGNKKEASITCIPVVESIQGDISGYIQTNLMGMTDGHIYFDVDLFGKGRRPAVNPFVSVTRVGRQTQTNLRRTISRELLSFLTLRERIENFAHFGAETNPTIKNTLLIGDQITAFFGQKSEVILELELQIFIFSLIWYGIWKSKTLDQLRADINRITEVYLINEKFRQSIIDIISKEESLNSLLTSLQQNAGKILQEGNIKL